MAEDYSWGLDPGSRLMLRGMFLRTSVLIAPLLCAWLWGLVPTVRISNYLGLVFTTGSMFAMSMALTRRHTPGKGQLNHWDECLALNGCAMLMHII